MKKVSYFLRQLNSDKKALIFCLLIFFVNLFYLYENNDNYFILGYGYGLEKIVNLNETSNPIININGFFLRVFSYLGNMIFFNFIFLMIYSLVFAMSKPSKIEALFVYFVNILLMLGILYIYIIMR
jgi:hypothetical protein